MNTIHSGRVRLAASVLVLMLAVVAAQRASAHCDTMVGPVVADAKAALASGDITRVLKWVGPDHEAEIRGAFDRTKAVRALGNDAQQLADQYFFETLVRLHREGEGAPYTGIKDEPVDPVIAMAEGSIASGSPDDVVRHPAVLDCYLGEEAV